MVLSVGGSGKFDEKNPWIQEDDNGKPGRAAMARRVNRKELCEAIRQSQARMKEQMEGTDETESHPKPEPVRFEMRQPMPRRETRPKKALFSKSLRKLKVNPKYLGFVAVIILFIGCLFVLQKAMSNRQRQRPQSDPQTSSRQNEPSMRGDGGLGQQPPRQETNPVTSSRRTENPETAQRQSPPPTAPQEPVVNPKGDHVIVIATYTKREHLVPVQEYFRSNGIETEIMRRGSYYLVVTKHRVESPRRTGTDGYQLLQKIRTIGAQYKAPGGFESFGRVPFQDAYGMKISR